MTKKTYKLDRPDRVLHSIIGRIDYRTPSHVLSGLLRKCPEFGEYIIEEGTQGMNQPRAKVTKVEVGSETRMVAPTEIKTTDVTPSKEVDEDEKEKETPKKRTYKSRKKTRKSSSQRKKKDE